MTAVRGGTTATASTASLRPSRCSGTAAPGGTAGTAPGPGSVGPEGSMGPGRGSHGGVWFEMRC